MQQVEGVASDITSKLKTEIANLRAKAREFNNAYSKLTANRPDPQKYPAEYAKWFKLKSYGDKTKASVARITRTIDTAGNIMDSIWYGVTHPFNTDPFGLDANPYALGILPAIPVAGVAITGAIIASSIAAMTYFISQAYQYGKFADSSPQVRQELQRMQTSSGIGGALASVKGILFIGAIIYLTPIVIDQIKKARK